MLVNIHHDNAREHNRLLVAGVAFLTVIAMLVWLSISLYNKAFDSTTTVTVKADRAGLQLAEVRRRTDPRGARRPGRQDRPGRRAGGHHAGA
ncbi:hypothetical protein G5V59_05460 [Nocardioides sp. W3-2-3]|uniref:hypothetical protein n=1 Tax=Nocardioides convexus TaxID=2712224 RepID=UPI0024185A37|nr:hypothetical protein [Nocardioides convexus]NGZ99890.1 hypothetical protein [Nocardioides convexus]